ncbi:MAG: glycosyl hydrolase family 8 [Acidobacteriota bacterium]
MWDASFRLLLGLCPAFFFCCTGKTLTSGTEPLTTPPVLAESWKVYVQKFIQEDGRVIDHKGGGISTSEGQAYAMLRAVWMRDREVFDKTFDWARNNLNSAIRRDRLWAWKWGRNEQGRWMVLDKAFASDADQDAALALIAAWEVWQDARYLNHARAMLADLWSEGTMVVNHRRYLLAGDTLCEGSNCRLNPSYCAPYAYRVFARYDKERNWSELVESSYTLLEEVSRLSPAHLPTDWIWLNRTSGRISLGHDRESRFSYDAFRTFWRVALDLELFDEPRARRYLETSLKWLEAEWNRHHRLPAVMSKEGRPLADYESPEMLGGLLPAMRAMRPKIAGAMRQRLDGYYQGGIWFDAESYYIQNWVWFGIALDDRWLGALERFRLFGR